MMMKTTRSLLLTAVALAVGACGSHSAADALGSTGPTARGVGQLSTAAYEPTTLLVKFQPDVSAEEKSALLTDLGASVIGTLDHLGVDIVRLADGEDPLEAAARYEEDPNVWYAHPNWRVQLLSTPNDLQFRELWGLHNTGQAVTGSFVVGKADADIDAVEGWDIAFGAGNFPSSGGPRVGVLDTGIDLAHVELVGKTKTCANATTSTGTVIEGTCSDDNLHGTHVAGTIAAAANNLAGVAGVAPNSELAIFKALDAAGVGFYADVVAGIHWLHTKGGARIISMSIGGPKDSALEAELSEAAGAGTLLIAAAGNDGDSTANYPAYHPDVMSVAATNARDERASFSNCNNDVEIAAPGVDIWSTLPGNTYGPLDGTSMATPHVSGVASLVLFRNPSFSASQIRDQLVGTVDDLGSGGRDSCFGYGRVNLASALGGTASPPPPAEPGAISGSVTDASTRAGIGGAVVDCGSGYSATTSSTGAYTISSVAAGTYTCTASASGYRKKSATVTVDPGATTTQNFALRKR